VVLPERAKLNISGAGKNVNNYLCRGDKLWTCAKAPSGLSSKYCTWLLQPNGILITASINPKDTRVVSASAQIPVQPGIDRAPPD
jgi:hypothetical protein